VFDPADREEKATSSRIAQIFALTNAVSACAEDHADFMVRFTLCDPNQNLPFARGETQ
jgi:hypothetical protein